MQSLTKVAFLSVSGQFSLFVLHTIIGTQMSLDFSHFCWVLYIYFLRKVISYKTWEGVVLWEPFEVSSAPSLADTQCGPLTSSPFPPHSLIFSFTSDLGWGCDTVNELCTTVLQNTFCLLYLTKTSFSLLFLPNRMCVLYLTMLFFCILLFKYQKLAYTAKRRTKNEIRYVISSLLDLLWPNLFSTTSICKSRLLSIDWLSKAWIKYRYSLDYYTAVLSLIQMEWLSSIKLGAASAFCQLSSNGSRWRSLEKFLEIHIDDEIPLLFYYRPDIYGL